MPEADEEKRPRGLLDRMERLEEERKLKAKAKKDAKPGDGLDLSRIG